MNRLLSHPFAADDPLAFFENSLAQSLKPVTPNPEFVQKLGRRIAKPPSITLERRTEMKVFAIIAFALFGGTLLVWLIITLARMFGGSRETNE